MAIASPPETPSAIAVVWLRLLQLPVKLSQLASAIIAANAELMSRMPPAETPTMPAAMPPMLRRSLAGTSGYGAAGA
jgi:hypothetical protein